DRRSRLVFIVRGIPRQIIENTLCKFAATIVSGERDMTENSKTTASGRLDRRTLLKAAGATGLASAMNVPLVNIARAAGNTLKIGWVGCLSGVRAQFAEPDPWIHERIKARLKDGLKIGGKTYQVELVFKDNQSDPNRSSVIASELVL
ncbi:hypothetical protein KXV33_006726, partial [Aspergillus fumigatus]